MLIMKFKGVHMNNKIIGGLLGLVSLFIANAASAATISLDPTTQTVATGDTLSISVLATEFPTVGTVGGGITLNWDPTILSLNTTLTDAIVDGAINTGFTDVLAFSSVPGQLDIAAAVNIVAPGAGTGTGAFTFLNLSFTALAPPGTAVSVALGQFGDWQDFAGNSIVGVIYNSASVTVTPNAVVPVPAAAWLFASGLLGLVGVARRRTA
jgi:hypothetical protein